MTVDQGTNVLLGLDPARIAEVPAVLRRANGGTRPSIPGWDGHAGRRLVDVLLNGA